MRAIVTVGEDGYVVKAEYLTDQEGPRKSIKLTDNEYSFHSSKVPSKFFKSWNQYKVVNGTLLWSPR